MRIARARSNEAFDEPSILPTPATFAEALTMIGVEVVSLTGGEKPARVVGGVAGALAADNDLLVRAPHLTDWMNRKVGSALAEAIGTPVELYNDADLATLGEANFGAGKGFQRVAYLTISTGVGGGLVQGGEIRRGRYTLEPGHQIIENGQTLEELISGTALEAKYNQKPYEIKDEAVWEEAARRLAVGLHNVIVFWSPEIIVVGGSMMKEIGIPLDKTIDHLRFIHKIYPELPEIRSGALGDQGGLYGALVLGSR